ncbi:DUF7694 domain-containing protein [Enterobacter hormaechei]|uniref:DUF7694 domain-containing protein n=1 Tax=Enterobacter hormaechei TaxID=158836 RepID=UPI003C2CF8D2
MKVPEKYRVKSGPLSTTAEDGNNGLFVIPRGNGSKQSLTVIVSDGGDWEHVSVSMKDRMPTWEDMDYIKGLFWDPTEAVMQLHVPKARHINNHPFCLHLWRPAAGGIPMPPQFMVGLPGVEMVAPAGGPNK